MPHRSNSIRTVVRITATCAVVMIFCTAPSGAQPKTEKADPLDMAQSDIELRKRLAPLIPSIRSALQGDNADSQRAALAIVADFPPGLAAEANLAASLSAYLERDIKDPELIALGLRSFGRSDPDPASITKVVERFVKSEHVIVRRAAAESLSTAVQNAPPSGRSVANATKFINVAKQTLPLLTTLVVDADSRVQRTALGGVQSAARVVAELYIYDSGPLADDLKPKDLETRFAAVSPIIKDLAAVVPKLAVPLDGPDPETRLAAARAADAIASVRRAILLAKGSGTEAFAEGWPTLRPAVTARMQDENAEVRLAVVEALETLGDALEARELLRQATADRTVFVRWAAARALGRTATPKTDPAAVEADVAALARLISDRDVDVRIATLTALSRFGPAAQPAAPAVLAATTRGDVEPRVVAIKTLTALETPAESTVPVLNANLAERDVRLRIAAASGLVRFGPDARPALPELIKAVMSTDPELRLAAAEAILAIDRKPRLKDL